MKKSIDPLGEFILELSTWYVRRSRDRFKAGDSLGMKTFYYVLLELSKLIAPFMPFLAEKLYQEMQGESESVHLDSWPEIKELSSAEIQLLAQMETARAVVEKSHNLRDRAGIKVRQPLASLQYNFTKEGLNKKFGQIIAAEVNVKEVKFNSKLKKEEVKLDTQLTPELENEGNLRELIRQVNALRKKSKFNY